MSSISPIIKQLEHPKKIIKLSLLILWMIIKYIFIKKKVRKIMTPPKRGVLNSCNFLFLSGVSNRAVWFEIALLNLFIKKIVKKIINVNVMLNKI